MKMAKGGAMIAAVLASTVLSIVPAQAFYWDYENDNFAVGPGEVVAYDLDSCTAPSCQGYFGFTAGHEYNYVGNAFNDTASCITIGPKTRIVIYEHSRFKGKHKEYINSSQDEIVDQVLPSDWDDKMSSIKVYSVN